MLAFSRLPAADQAAFIRENPDSWLNTHRRQGTGPPAPPGTMAYAQWYWQQVMASWQVQAQLQTQGFPGHGYVPAEVGVADWQKELPPQPRRF